MGKIKEGMIVKHIYFGTKFIVLNTKKRGLGYSYLCRNIETLETLEIDDIELEPTEVHYTDNPKIEAGDIVEVVYGGTPSRRIGFAITPNKSNTQMLVRMPNMNKIFFNNFELKVLKKGAN